jgi:hypothetical protein
MSGSSLNNYNEVITAEQSNLISIFESSKVVRYDDDDSELISSETMSKEYILSLSLTSNEEVVDESKYDGDYVVGDLSPTSDVAYYYYITFKQEKSSFFAANSSEKSGLTYYYDKFLNVSNYEVKAYFDDSSTYKLLLSSYATALDNFISTETYTTTIDDVTYDGREIYIDLYQSYKVVLDEARDDLSSNYTPYIESTEKFDALRSSIIRIKIMEIFASYLSIMFVRWFIIPMIFKDGRTLTFKFMNIAATSIDGKRVKCYSNILSFLIESMMFLMILPIFLVLIYGNSSIYFFTFNLGLNLNLLILYVFSFAVLITSLIVLIIDKKKRRTISDFASLRLIKDIRE